MMAGSNDRIRSEGAARIAELTQSGFSTNATWEVGDLSRKANSSTLLQVVSIGTSSRYGIRLELLKMTSDRVHGWVVEIEGDDLLQSNHRKVTLRRAASGKIKVEPGWNE
jgi:hypothetical protein